MHYTQKIVVHFVTRNADKFAIAKRALAGAGVELVQEPLDTPEIQSTDVQEIAKFSARWAADRLGKPAITSDAGYYITALNGFPGPFIKYVNKWLTPDDFLRLMNGKKDRSVVVKDCLAYCEPGKEPHTFLGEARGTIAERVVLPGKTPISTVFIPEGYDKTEPELTEEEMIEFWRKNMEMYRGLGAFLKPLTS